MYECFRCKSRKLIEVNAKCSDCCYIYNFETSEERYGYAPRVLHKFENFDDDYVGLVFCSRCGQIQHPDFQKDPVNVS